MESVDGISTMRNDYRCYVESHNNNNQHQQNDSIKTDSYSRDNDTDNLDNEDESESEEDYVFSSEDDITLNQCDELIFEIKSLDSNYKDNMSLDIEEFMSNDTDSSSSDSAEENDVSINNQLIHDLHDDILQSTKLRADIRIGTFFKLFKISWIMIYAQLFVQQEKRLKNNR